MEVQVSMLFKFSIGWKNDGMPVGVEMVFIVIRSISEFSESSNLVVLLSRDPS